MPHNGLILVVEDERAERDALARLLRLSGYEVQVAAGVKQALATDIADVELIISDLRLGNQSGTDLLQKWRELGVQAPCIFVTAFGDVPTAVTAMKLGATDYLTKPVDPGNLLRLAKSTIELSRSSKIRAGQANISTSTDVPIVWTSQAMSEVMERVDRAAQTDSIVLILGESGTGKELVAQAVHRQSNRSKGPFIAVNIAAIPRELVESELFGHVRGSFTGATGDRQGKFELATGGTLFIDEVGDFELSAQAKILRVLESRTVSPVGSNEDINVDARVVAATSRDLDQMVRDAAFREDLYYRLSVVVIVIPPLRHRRDDIAMLVNHFAEDVARQMGREKPAIHPDLMRRMIQFDWPGNVRQLRNAIESMTVMATGDVLRVEDFPSHLAKPPIASELAGDPSASKTLEAVEKQYTFDTLRECRGNRTHAASRLGISVRTLQRRLKAWGLQELPPATGGDEDDDDEE